MGAIFIAMGLFWITFSRRLAVWSVRYYRLFGIRLIPRQGWRIILVMMGNGAIILGVLALTGAIPKSR